MRNRNIDVLRGILTIMIMFYHYTFRFSEIYGYETINFWSLKDWGSIGVGCFFIITGYFLLPKNSIKNINFSWLKRKILRLFPQFFLAISLTFILVRLIGLPGREVTFFQYLLNIPFINGFINTPYVDGAHWYLTYLIIFYFLIYLVSYFSKKMDIFNIWPVRIILIVNLIFKIIKIPFIYKILGGDYLAFILIGICLKNNFKNNKVYFELFIYLLLIYFNFGMTIFGFILIFILIFIFFTNKKTNFSKNNLLYFIGEISYVVYLLHQNLGYLILFHLMELNNIGQYYLIYLLLTIVIIIAISKFIYLFSNKIIYNLSQFFERKKIYD